jgi:hypothetical protein
MRHPDQVGTIEKNPANIPLKDLYDLTERSQEEFVAPMSMILYIQARYPEILS